MANEESNTDQQAAPVETTSPWRGRIIAAIVLVLPLFGGIGLGYTNYGVVAKATSAMFSSSSDGSREFGTFGELKNVVVNPAGTNGGRYLMVSLGLEADSQAPLEEVEEKEVVIRDVAIKYLSSKRPSELADPEEREVIKVRLQEKINEMLSKGQVNQLYFTQYVLQ